ncbi:MAG: amidohydrolase [Chloroflexi bacterium]|nr:amidohydrolase [Chloroflexota bacterium]
MWDVEGLVAPNVGFSTMAGKDFDQHTSKANNFKDMRPGCYDPKARVKDMDLDGVKTSVCFPGIPGLGGERLMSIKDVELRDWAISAYNDYLTDEFQAASPDRLIGLGVLPLTEPEKAVAELKRIARKGIRGLTVPFWIDGHVPGAKPLFDSMYGIVWSACEASAIPINLHFSAKSRGATPVLTATTPGLAEAYVTGLPLINFEILAQLIWTGVLERHPKLKVISSEGGIGWVPYFLERADYTYNRHHRTWSKGQVKTKPSDYFPRQCYVCFITDRAGVLLRDLIGVDSMMWEADYPHADTSWPFSHDRVDESLAGVSAKDRKKIVYDTAAGLYHLN